MFAKRKLGHYGGEPKVMRGGWFEGFIQLGFEWVVFLSPTHCPYGANWGNCIVMKHKPDEVRCGHLKGEGCVQFKQVWDAQESRCYVGVRYVRAYDEGGGPALRYSVEQPTSELRSPYSR